MTRNHWVGMVAALAALAVSLWSATVLLAQPAHLQAQAAYTLASGSARATQVRRLTQAAGSQRLQVRLRPLFAADVEPISMIAEVQAVANAEHVAVAGLSVGAPRAVPGGSEQQASGSFTVSSPAQEVALLQAFEDARPRLDAKGTVVFPALAAPATSRPQPAAARRGAARVTAAHAAAAPKAQTVSKPRPQPVHAAPIQVTVTLTRWSTAAPAGAAAPARTAAG